MLRFVPGYEACQINWKTGQPQVRERSVGALGASRGRAARQRQCTCRLAMAPMASSTLQLLQPAGCLLLRHAPHPPPPPQTGALLLTRPLPAHLPVAPDAQAFALFASSVTARTAVELLHGVQFDDTVFIRAEMARKNLYSRASGMRRCCQAAWRPRVALLCFCACAPCACLHGLSCAWGGRRSTPAAAACVRDAARPRAQLRPQLGPGASSSAPPPCPACMQEGDPSIKRNTRPPMLMQQNLLPSASVTATTLGMGLATTGGRGGQVLGRCRACAAAPVGCRAVPCLAAAPRRASLCGAVLCSAAGLQGQGVAPIAGLSMPIMVPGGRPAPPCAGAVCLPPMDAIGLVVATRRRLTAAVGRHCCLTPPPPPLRTPPCRCPRAAA
jgi:hypothetical protein